MQKISARSLSPVGSPMLTFEKTMSRVLKVSPRKMRDKLLESLKQYMMTLEG